MKEFVKCIQLTDIHIDVHNLVYGRDPRVPFEACLYEIKKEHMDAEFIIITGDYTHRGDVESLCYVKEMLSTTSIPYFFVLGNHDSREALSTVMPDHPRNAEGFIQYSVETDFGLCIVLDSVEEGVSQGTFCYERLYWLSQELEKTSRPVFLFLHHPPCILGMPATNNIILSHESSKRLFEVLYPYKERIRHIFMGHIHRPICGSWHGIPFSSLPSLSHQAALDLHTTDRILGITEPSGYGIILVNEDQVIVHFKECGESRRTIYF